MLKRISSCPNSLVALCAFKLRMLIDMLEFGRLSIVTSYIKM